MRLPRLSTGVLMTGLLLLNPAYTQEQVSPLAGLQPVGSTTLKWMFLTIYNGSLFSVDGQYESIEPDLALQLEYRRNINADRLIETTRDQWREMGLYTADQSEPWLTALQQLWPDVSRGDTITLRVGDDMGALFFYNGRLLGRLDDADFTQDFLAIWLGDNTRFPELRDELIGAR